jgi:YVTN family beta-propeller protein
VVGKITGLFGVHGIAIVSDLNKGFISNGTDNSVTIFDTKTLEVITKVPVTGTKPDCIMYDSFSKNIFTMNGKTNNSTVINAETNKVIATIKFSGKPEFAVSNGKGLVYVNYEEESKIGVINTTTLKEETAWAIAPGEGPTGLALDRKNNRLFSVCANKMMVIVDATTGKIISTPTIGEDPDGAAFDPTLKCAYSSSNMGTMTVVKEGEDGKYSVLENVTSQQGAKTIAVNRKTHHIYMSAADFEAKVGTAKPKMIPGSFVVLDVMPL